MTVSDLQKWALLSGLEESTLDNDSNNKQKGNERIGRTDHSTIAFYDDGIYRMIVFGGKVSLHLSS